jgi:hypothetical protein
VQQLIQKGASSADFAGAKPTRPETWHIGDAVILEPAHAEEAKKAVPEPEMKASKAGKKRGKYQTRSDEVKYLFWELHRDWNSATLEETVGRINRDMPVAFSAPLKFKTAQGWNDFKVRTQPAVQPAEKQQRGPKKRKLAPGEFAQWNNMRVSVPILMTLSAMVMGVVAAGVPITTRTALALALGLFAANDITWKPKWSWAYKFMHRIGLSPRRGTRPARALPSKLLSICFFYALCT